MSSDDICVPVGIGSYRISAMGVAAAWCQVKVAPATRDADVLQADITLLADNGAVIAAVQGLELRRITREALQRIASAGSAQNIEPDWAFDTEWLPIALEDADESAAPGRWVVFADDSALGEQLAGQLEEHLDSAALVTRGDSFARSARGWSVDPSDLAQIRLALDEAARADDRELKGVLILWGLEAQGSQTIDALESRQQILLRDLLYVSQALGDSAARRWLFTRASQAIDGSVPDLTQATLWGLGGVVTSEAPQARCVRIDLDPVLRADEAALVFASVWNADAEDRVGLREGTRFGARLVPAAFVAAEKPQRLEIVTRGSLENLQLLDVRREPPGPNEVEIRVLATGLNFRDVLNALGMYPGDPGALGNECAGVISAVGEGVDDVHVGDEVIAMVDRSFATWVLAPAALTVLKPAELTFAEAATIPVTFLTAQYALTHLAHMKKGDRVLIHAITGGVGMAAAQLARRAGAEIFGTAGSPAKRALALELGAQHIADSRSLGFAADVLRDSDGEGVDIVLNSLAGDFIPTSLRMLRPGGHFIEIGKTGIWDAARVAQDFPGIHYHPLYLGEIAAARPHFVRDMLKELLVDFANGVLQPLPQRLYPLARAEDAFRYMGQGHHVGKIVITQHATARVRADASYLVTGGLTGLGLLTARWLVREGARHLVLVGRRLPDATARSEIAAMEAGGAEVIVAQADVADTPQMQALFQRIAAQMPRLRGVIHAAGVVDDGLLAEQDMARFARVMAPKVRGSWNLHELTARLPLDFFIGFSSGAALLGSPGQSNYAAANSFLDALAHRRRAQGHHALSINWGSWSGAGMAAQVSEQHRRRWAATGLGLITPEAGMRMMKHALERARAPQIAALPIVRARLPANLGPFYSALVSSHESSADSAPPEPTADILATLSASPSEMRHAVLVTYLTAQITRVLALPSSRGIDPDRSLMELGLDSLMAMELRNRLQTALHVRIAVGDLLQGIGVARLATLILADSGAQDSTSADEPAVPAYEEGTL